MSTMDETSPTAVSGSGSDGSRGVRRSNSEA